MRNKSRYVINKDLNLSPDKCIGFSTLLQPFQIADILNKILDIELYRISDLVQINSFVEESSDSMPLFNKTPSKTEFHHQFYYYYDDLYRTDYILLQNKSLNNCIINELKKYDNLLFIIDDSQNSLECVLENSKSIVNTYSVILDLNESKNLSDILDTLEEIEMHLIQESVKLK
ncbi:MAG: hypothetical protein ACOX4D_02475 [Bacteroidales bacterium]|jgi:hypothetical protein